MGAAFSVYVAHKLSITYTVEHMGSTSQSPAEAEGATMQTTTAIAVEFTTRRYVLGHGHEPHGVGSWAFEFEDDSAPWFAPSMLTLGDAKKAAVAEALRRTEQLGCGEMCNGGIASFVVILP